MHLLAIVLFSMLPVFAAAAAAGFALLMPPAPAPPSPAPTELELALLTLAGQMNELGRQLALALNPAIVRCNEAMRALERAWRRGQ